MTEKEKKQRRFSFFLFISCIIAASFISVKCGDYSHELENSIKEDMQEQISTNQEAFIDMLGSYGDNLDDNIFDDDYLIKVKDVSVIKLDKKNYSGIATLSIGDFSIKKKIKIVISGNSYMWEVED